MQRSLKRAQLVFLIPANLKMSSEANAPFTCLTGDHVRSEKIHIALAYGNTRFEICNMIAKGMRMTHRNGTRMEDSINRVLGMIGPKVVVAKIPPPPIR